MTKTSTPNAGHPTPTGGKTTWLAFGMGAAIWAGVGCSENAPPPPTAQAPVDWPASGVLEGVWAAVPPTIDGVAEPTPWGMARWSAPFLDIEGPDKPAPRHDTRVQVMWDQTHLYIFAQLDEPHLWGSQTEHDSVIFHENDFEVFLDPGDDGKDYVELEINALNTTWDLILAKPYREGGTADNSFEIEGLRTAVQRRGTLNDPSDLDDGWSVEIAIPWKALAPLSPNPLPPLPGDSFRIGFSRVQWDLEIKDGAYHKVPGKAEHNWVWSPQGEVNMHIPERWGRVTFQGPGGEPKRK